MFEINSTFTIDNIFTLQNCILKFGVNGGIVVGPSSNAFFTCDNSELFSCQSPGWQGIRLIGSGIMYFTSNHIEDAQTAISIESSTCFSIISANRFYNNLSGMDIDHAGATQTIILGNTFDCSRIKPSDIGISVKQASVDIGFANSTGTAFSNKIVHHRIGIDCTNGSYVRMFNIEVNCSRESGVQSLYSRIFIGKVNTVLIDPPSTMLIDSKFYSNNRDIYAQGSNLEINSCSMTNCTGINIQSTFNTLAEQIFIHHNTIDVTGTGGEDANGTKGAIRVIRPSGYPQPYVIRSKIHRNSINIQDYGVPKSRFAVFITGQPSTVDRTMVRKEFGYKGYLKI